MRISEAPPTPLPSLTRMQALMLVENRAGEGGSHFSKGAGKIGVPFEEKPNQ